MTKNEILNEILKKEFEFYGLRALTKENAEQLKNGEDLANSVAYCDDYSYEEAEELNGVSTIGIDAMWETEEELERALELIKNYEDNGIVLIAGNNIDNYSYDEGELVISNPTILGYLER